MITLLAVKKKRLFPLLLWMGRGSLKKGRRRKVCFRYKRFSEIFHFSLYLSLPPSLRKSTAATEETLRWGGQFGTECSLYCTQLHHHHHCHDHHHVYSSIGLFGGPVFKNFVLEVIYLPLLSAKKQEGGEIGGARQRKMMIAWKRRRSRDGPPENWNRRRKVCLLHGTAEVAGSIKSVYRHEISKTTVPL